MGGELKFAKMGGIAIVEEAGVFYTLVKMA